ncbi:MAG: beta-lactamase family protein [Alphaproteobacteria bacterium]|nr:beta-lactamase family protein [Alphaproteobacteria bacterium]
MKFLQIAALVAGLATTGPGILATEVPVAAPETVGLASSGLDAIRSHFQAQVDGGKLSGLTTLVSRKGKVVHFEAYGRASLEQATSVEKDSIFRIYSMTKPVTGVALMMLHEEGLFGLDDPVSQYLPEFAAPKVFKSQSEDGIVETVAAHREITIRDLMRHTAGLTYGVFGDTPVDRLYKSGGVLEAGLGPEEWISRLAAQPLLYQPGDAWVYSFAVDVQGRLVEVLSGMSLDAFFETRIFAPLGMVDTGFYLDTEKAERLVTMYFRKDDVLTPTNDPYFPDFTKKPASFSGGGGLVSTTRDYWRFAQMLLNGGELDGVRILKPETVAMMTTDQLPEKLDGIAGGQRGIGFGLDLGIVKDVGKRGGYGREGEFFWGGMANTIFWVDPKEELVAILMTNILPQGLYPLSQDMHRLVYQALGAE